MIGIGIDTGGTYTDAVAYDMETKQVLSYGKALTTKERLETGIGAALDTLNPEHVRRAGLVALSTTLATNACVEDKGSRARLLMIGVEPETVSYLEGVYRAYGFRELSQLVFLDGKPEGIYKHPEDPDWEGFSGKIREKFGDCRAAGVVQVYPGANGGRFERKAAGLLKKELGIPVTMACEMFDETDVLKRGAGTLLNARLIPLIADFLRAVKNVMGQRGIHAPVAIVRSDGSLMSEEAAGECPVETLLSGPAASVVGGSVLAGEPDAVIVDMGGTTTDVAIVRDGRPVTARDGISIGPWKTMVKGLYVDTFVLGGDSAVRFRDGKLYLASRRVIPVSVLASRYPGIVGKLKKLADRGKGHTRMLHEFYVLQKDISDNPDYTSQERALCEALKDGPLLPEELAKILKSDLYHLPGERLEEEGILMRSGLTPTDTMVLKGDFTVYEPEAAQEALRYAALNVTVPAEEIPDRIYDMVEEKLYENIARILMSQKYPRQEKLLGEEGVRRFLAWSYRDAKNGFSDPLMSSAITTKLPIIGVGAPIHVFLPRVAALLGTRAVIKETAPVANALGAIAGQIAAKVRISVKAEYSGAQFQGFLVLEGEKRRLFEKYEEAEAFAAAEAKRLAAEKARRQGAGDSLKLQVSIEKIRDDSVGSGIFFESIIEAVATGAFS